jgi:hypothetical protein
MEKLISVGVKRSNIKCCSMKQKGGIGKLEFERNEKNM